MTCLTQVKTRPEKNPEKYHKAIETFTFRKTDLTYLEAKKFKDEDLSIQALFQDFMQFSRFRQSSSTLQAKGWNSSTFQIATHPAVIH